MVYSKVWVWVSKTVSTLTAIDEMVYERFTVRKVLVIAPLRVAQSVWSDEAMKWEHLSRLRLSKALGSLSERLKGLNTLADIYLINRENVTWLVELFGAKWPFDMVVIDESSSFKNHSSQRFKALKKVRGLIRHIVLLSGTPAPRSYLNLWPQLFLLDQGQRLGKTITGYKDRYFEPGQRSPQGMIYSWKLKPSGEAAIKAKISDICVSMAAADWLTLQEPLINDVLVSMTPAALRLYKQLEHDLLLPYAAGDVVANTAAVLSGKLLQMANGAVYDEHKRVQHIHDAKLDALADLVEDAQGEPVLIFYNYIHDRDRIKAKIPGVRELKTPKDIADWNKGLIPVLLAHPASCGHGLNLQDGGHIIVWFGLSWDLELYLQANARLQRSGQQAQVIIHRLLTAGTIDSKCAEALVSKGSRQDSLLAAIKATIKNI